jgi:hypothetical protein
MATSVVKKPLSPKMKEKKEEREEVKQRITRYKQSGRFATIGG